VKAPGVRPGAVLKNRKATYGRLVLLASGWRYSSG
jgi:hypothetical protein